MKKVFCFQIVLYWSLTTMLIASNPIESTIAYASKDEVWQAFRTQFPLYQQIIGAVSVQSDGSCLLLLSELPPHATIDGVKDILKDRDVFLEEKKHTIGYDGWVKDLLVVINNTDHSEVQCLYKNLYNYLFFTDPIYQAYDLSITTKPVFFTEENLDIKISIAALQKWLLSEESEDFTAIGDTEGRELDLTQIIQKQLFGVWHSVNSGLVLWVMPPEGDISDKKVEIRQFAENTDLIIGGIRMNNGVAIIGRQRVLSTALLPVMRTETILALASSKTLWLSQSYERSHPLAGEVGDNSDWAPIYLSPELLNTDFGGGLDIADQMLKSWSLNGLVQYRKFEHPTPNKWPFPRPIDKLLNSESTVFNWNSANATVTVDVGHLTIVSASRTGALPVVYIPSGGDSKGKEDTIKICQSTASEYFATLGSPVLAQVTQYALLFKLIKQFKIKASLDLQICHLNVNSLQTETFRLLNTISLLNTEQVSELAKKVVLKNSVIDSVKREISEKHNNLPEDEKRQIFLNLLNQQIKDFKIAEECIKKFIYNKEQVRLEIEHFKNKICEVKQTYGEHGLKKLAELLGDPGGRHNSPVDDPESKLLVEMAHNCSQEMENVGFMPTLYDFLDISLDKIQKSFVLQNEKIHKPWIKTPVVVLSYNVDTLDFGSGGHHLEGREMVFHVDKTVQTIKIQRLPGSKSAIVTLGESLWPRLTPEITEKLKRELSKTELESDYWVLEMEMREALMNSPVKIVLNFNEVFTPANMVKWQPESLFVIRKEADTTYLINGTQTKGCSELNLHIEKYLRENNLAHANIKLENMSPDEAKAVLEQAKIRLSSHVQKTFLSKKTALEPEIRRAEYGFRNYDLNVTKSDNDLCNIEICIPQLTRQTARVNIRVTNIARQNEEQVKAAIFTAFRRSRKTDIDLLGELRKELKALNIKGEDISTELVDCFICFRPDTPTKQNNGKYSELKSACS